LSQIAEMAVSENYEDFRLPAISLILKAAKRARADLSTLARLGIAELTYWAENNGSRQWHCADSCARVVTSRH